MSIAGDFSATARISGRPGLRATAWRRSRLVVAVLGQAVCACVLRICGCACVRACGPGARSEGAVGCSVRRAACLPGADDTRTGVLRRPHAEAIIAAGGGVVVGGLEIRRMFFRSGRNKPSAHSASGRWRAAVSFQRPLSCEWQAASAASCGAPATPCPPARAAVMGRGMGPRPVARRYARVVRVNQTPRDALARAPSSIPTSPLRVVVVVLLLSPPPRRLGLRPLSYIYAPRSSPKSLFCRPLYFSSCLALLRAVSRFPSPPALQQHPWWKNSRPGPITAARFLPFSTPRSPASTGSPLACPPD
jgi:hypothetical protein